MRNYLYLIAAAAIYFTIKEVFELHGIGGGIIGGTIAGGIVGCIAWLVEKKINRKNKEQ